MTFHAPALTPATGAYALLAIAVIAALSWIVGRARADRGPISDPIEEQLPEPKPEPRAGHQARMLQHEANGGTV